jgi:hypothetical protein
MATMLLLGPVVFQDFELPARVRFGGTQRLAVHQMPGGARVIDMLGRDDAEIGWSGVFSGSDAPERARLIDLMRAEGGVWPLTWDAFFYSVIVSRFEAEYARPNWIPYRAICTVLRDEAQALVEEAVSLIGGVAADLASASGAGIDLTAANSSVAVSGAGVRGSAAYGAAVQTVTSASASADATVSAAETDLQSATGLSGMTSAAGTLAQAADARGFIRRAAANLANAST